MHLSVSEMDWARIQSAIKKTYHISDLGSESFNHSWVPVAICDKDKDLDLMGEANLKGKK